MSGQQGGSRWGGFLSGAVAGLESRLDTILAEDNQASAKSRAAEAAAKQDAAEKAATQRLQVDQGGHFHNLLAWEETYLLGVDSRASKLT
jgi:hypothetical protein